MGGVVQSREDVFALQERVIRQDLLERGSRPEQFEHIRYADPLPANAGSAPALAGFYRDSIETFQIHRIACHFDDTQSSEQRQEARGAEMNYWDDLGRAFCPQLFFCSSALQRLETGKSPLRHLETPP
jgi:hypothetical protein